MYNSGNSNNRTHSPSRLNILLELLAFFEFICL